MRVPGPPDNRVPVSRPPQRRSEAENPSEARVPGRPEYQKNEHRPQSRPIPAPPALKDTAIQEDTRENLLSGRNPIREAIKSGRDIEKLLVVKGELSGTARAIVMEAKEKRIPVQVVERERLDELTRNHQGMVAFASAYHYADVKDMLALARERGEEPFLIILDGVTDPHNLGAIIRTAECSGAHGVIVPVRRSAGLTPAAVRASAGAVEHLPVARVTNLSRLIQDLRREGIWFYAADARGEDYASVDFKGGVALVIGAEGDGISRLVLEYCDKHIALPLKGRVASLNASVAAGVLMYRVLASRGT